VAVSVSREQVPRTSGNYKRSRPYRPGDAKTERVETDIFDALDTRLVRRSSLTTLGGSFCSRSDRETTTVKFSMEDNDNPFKFSVSKAAAITSPLGLPMRYPASFADAFCNNIGH